jgi:hypothetical protein
MDIKVLFHNPESLSDEELRAISRKIQLQRSVPWTSAAFGALTWYLFQGAYLRRTPCYKSAAVAGLLGFVVGAYSVNSGDYANQVKRLEGEHDIVNAFD